MAQLKFLCNRLIPIDIGILEVIQQTAALTNHHEQPAARAMVLLILLEVFGQMIDSLREQRNLHVRGPCVLFVQLKIANCLRFCFHTY